jgi:type IV fimbrial biogenesis protein FimT
MKPRFKTMMNNSHLNTTSKIKAFTLLEALITVAIVGILAAIALPSYNESIASSQMRSNAFKLVGALQLARVEAVKRGEHVIVAPITAGNWNAGIRVWVDEDRGGDYDVAEFVIRTLDATEGTGAFTNASANIVFLSTGFISSASTFGLCDSRTGETGRQISLLISGRINSTTSTCS